MAPRYGQYSESKDAIRVSKRRAAYSPAKASFEQWIDNERKQFNASQRKRHAARAEAARREEKATKRHEMMQRIAAKKEKKEKRGILTYFHLFK
jgi:hypothetical protein